MGALDKALCNLPVAAGDNQPHAAPFFIPPRRSPE